MKLKNILSNEYLLLLARIFLGGVFIFAGMQKISDPSGFAKSVYDYRIFPEAIINFLAVVIPWLETVSGVLLLFGILVRENAAILSSLLFLFIILVVISISRGLDIECGCFGTASGVRTGWQKVLENSVLALLGLYVIYFEKGSLKLE